MHRSAIRLGAAALCGLAAACSSDVSPVRTLGLGAGYGPKPVTAPDFVAESRKADRDFLPVGVDAPARPVRAKSTDGQKALQSELEGARDRNVARGRAAESAGRTAPPARAAE